MPSFDSLVAELAELIAIPSVSADPAHQADVAAAAEWVADRFARAGGSAEVVPWGERPLVVGEIRASQSAETAPTILCYGHFDVQPPDPLELWESRRSSSSSATAGSTRAASPTTRASCTCC